MLAKTLVFDNVLTSPSQTPPDSAKLERVLKEERPPGTRAARSKS
jgi:hypothetical protein